MTRLETAGLAEYFLYPQINWNPKSDSIRRIAASLNIGTDALAFIDDQEFELAEVGHALPEVLRVRADQVAGAAGGREFRPRFITSESRERRRMYRASETRDHAEQAYVGTSEAFLATLGMRMRISRAGPDDLQRAEELTVRTNQLNSTGATFGPWWRRGSRSGRCAFCSCPAGSSRAGSGRCCSTTSCGSPATQEYGCRRSSCPPAGTG
jgi:FkbH-like protein